MSRPIKYQAYECETNEMITWDEIIELDDLGLVPFVEMLSATERYKMRQYTGLNDRYGTEIYDGDIVGIKGHAFEGAIKIDGVYVVGYNDRMELCCGSWLLHRELPYITVIGNKFQHPHLLKGETYE